MNTRLFLDRSPGQCFHDLSTAELVALAKRIVQGPQTWSLSHASQPIVTHQHILHLKSEGVLYWENEAKLLPGGRHVLFNNWDVLECWSVAEDRLVWKHESLSEHARVQQFAAEVIDNGRAATIVICQRVYSDPQRQKCVPHSFQCLQ